MNPIDYFNNFTGKPITIYMRRDSSSGSLPSVIDGTLKYYDVRNGMLIVSTKDGDLVLDNRGARSYFRIGVQNVR